MDERPRLPADVEQLVRWWTAASQEERFAAWKKACEEGAPPLEKIRLAALIAEANNGEIAEG